MANLRKVVKTVRGKRGTVRRSYWVKSQGDVSPTRLTLGQFARKHGKMWAGSNLAIGTAGGAGLSLGVNQRPLGASVIKYHLGGYLAGRLGASALFKRNKQHKVMQDDYRRMGRSARIATRAVGAAAHLAGVYGGAVAMREAHNIVHRRTRKH